MARLGRPRGEPSEKLAEKLTVPLTLEQLMSLERDARRARYRSVAAFARDKLFAIPREEESNLTLAP